MKIKSENVKILTLDLEENDISGNQSGIQQLSNILKKENKNLHIHINLNNGLNPNIIQKLLDIKGIDVIANMNNKIILSKKKSNDISIETDVEPVSNQIEEAIVAKPDIIMVDKLDLFKLVEKKAIRSGHILEILNSFKVLQENINNGGVLDIKNSFVFLTKHNKGKIILNDNSGLLFQKGHHLGVIEFDNVLINDYVEDLIKYSDKKSVYLYLFVENQQLKYDFI